MSSGYYVEHIVFFGKKSGLKRRPYPCFGMSFEETFNIDSFITGALFGFHSGDIYPELGGGKSKIRLVCYNYESGDEPYKFTGRIHRHLAFKRF